jgi:hypothetical protein
MAGCCSSSRSTRALNLEGLDDDLAVAVLKQSPQGSLGSFASASSRLSRLVSSVWHFCSDVQRVAHVCMSWSVTDITACC